MSDYMVLVFLGVMELTVLVLAKTLRDTTKKITDTNEKLLVLLGTRDGGTDVGRALVASMREPKKEITGVATQKDEPKGLKFTVGAR